MVTDIVILTPEKTILSFRLAGLGVRVGAHLIDLLICVAMLIALFFIMINAAAALPGLVAGVMLMAVSLGWFVYFVLWEGLGNGQTPGKRMTGIRVRSADGTPVTMMGALGRNLVRPADMLPGPYLVGFVAMFTNTKLQRLGDLVANTIVVYERRQDRVYAAAPHTAGIHPLEDIVGDLRGLTLAEYNVLRRFCDRYPELTPDVQNRLLGEVWAPIAQRRNVPQPRDIHPIYLAEATVMKYGRRNGLL